jgi:hypothetical protein
MSPLRLRTEGGCILLLYIQPVNIEIETLVHPTPFRRAGASVVLILTSKLYHRFNQYPLCFEHVHVYYAGRNRVVVEQITDVSVVCVHRNCS